MKPELPLLLSDLRESVAKIADNAHEALVAIDNQNEQRIRGSVMALCNSGFILNTARGKLEEWERSKRASE